MRNAMNSSHKAARSPFVQPPALPLPHPCINPREAGCTRFSLVYGIVAETAGSPYQNCRVSYSSLRSLLYFSTLNSPRVLLNSG
jgi:hypothetical protein